MSQSRLFVCFDVSGKAVDRVVETRALAQDTVNVPWDSYGTCIRTHSGRSGPVAIHRRGPTLSRSVVGDLDRWCGSLDPLGGRGIGVVSPDIEEAALSRSWCVCGTRRGRYLNRTERQTMFYVIF